MVRRGVQSPRRTAAGESPTTPFHASFEQRPMDPFPGHVLFPNRDNPPMQHETATPEGMTATERTDEIRRLEEIAGDAQRRLDQLRADNDAAETGPSRAASGNRESSSLRITKKVVGWSLAAGVALLGGVFIYGRLQAAGVDPDALKDAVTS